MKRINIGLSSLLLLGVLFSCSKASLDYTQNGNWVSRAIFEGVPMGFGASFVIGNNAYVGTGVNPVNPNARLQTMFEYTPSGINTTSTTGYDSAYGAWSQIADFPGSGRSGATGFSINSLGLGYLGSGTADGFTPLADFYQYTPLPVNSWAPIASLGSSPTSLSPRYWATSFSFDTVGYVLTGYDSYYFYGDVYKYSPATQSWTQLPDYPGSKRAGACTWVYNGNGYLVTGQTAGSQYSVGNVCYDFWSFNPNLPGDSAWSRKHDIYNTNASQTYDDGYTNIIRTYAASFIIKGTTSGDKGYISTGSNGTLYNYTWEYDFVSDLWTEKTPYEGSAREGAVGFTLGTTTGAQNRGFVATGLIPNSQTAFDDCREFFPNQIYNQYD